jgi:ATP-dependent RNA helicase RhlE
MDPINTITHSTRFSDFNLIEPIQRAIIDAGYTVATPIQSQAIPQLLVGRDLLGCAQTGTGKTAAFALPILNHLTRVNRRAEPRKPRALILTPTRELAVQIEESFRTYGKHLKLRHTVVFGGVSQGAQVRALSQGVDILVATPGRLLDLIEQRHLSLGQLEVFVLDEADRMLDMGFIHDIHRIIKMLPPKRQNLFFSATMPKEAKRIADTILTDPMVIEIVPESTTAEKIKQSLMYVEKKMKQQLLLHVLQDKSLSRVIVFTRTKHGANRVSDILGRNGITSDAIHGNKSQNARQKALARFRAGEVRVLVATDVAARGIDIDDISHVINFEIPNVAESYVHRIGRTARAGADGIAFSFCDSEERSFIRDIERITQMRIPVDKNHPYHSTAVEGAQLMSPGKAKAIIEGRTGGGNGGRRYGRNRNGGGGGRNSGGRNGGGRSGGNRGGGRH